MKNGLRIRTVLAVGIVCALVFSLGESTEDYVSHRDWVNPDTFGHILLYMQAPWLTVALLTPIVAWLVDRYPLGEQMGVRAWAVHLTAAPAFAVVHLLLLATKNHFQFAEAPPILATTSMLLATYFTADLMKYGAIAGTLHAVRYYRVARERERSELALRAALSDSKLDALRRQLQPHFLFNALNTASMLVRTGKSAEATEMIAALGSLLRKSMEAPATPKTPLRDELAVLESYLTVEEFRFGDRLHILLEIEPGTETALVPSLILQPLVENALRHGLCEAPGQAVVGVHARREHDTLRLEVRDNGRGLPDEWSLDERIGIGLSNTRQRLAQLYGDAWVLNLYNEPAGGAVAAVTIPFVS